jgi:hypothetical protein
MISDGKTMYVWSSALPQGFKMPAPTPGMAPQPDTSQAKIYTQNVDYNCSPWTADASEFALPAGVTFADLSSMMGMVGKGPMARPGMPAMNCSLCDQVPKGHGRDQCRAAMHCHSEANGRALRRAARGHGQAPCAPVSSQPCSRGSMTG